jgi:uncharacterized membrane protein YdjX (TVP38/TMEM64 family)
MKKIKLIKKIILILLILAAIISSIKIASLPDAGLSIAQKNFYLVKIFAQEHSLLSVFLYSFIFIFCISLSIPLGNVLTVLAGAIFGEIKGAILCAFSSALGATLAMILSRTLLRETILEKNQKKIEKLLNPIETHGFLYLLSLRLAFIIPFAIINWASGLSKIKIKTFFTATLIGQLPIKFVFSSSGAKLLTMQKIGDVLNPYIIATFIFFALLGITFTTLTTIKSKKTIN